jgi:hypothetical protein
MTANGPACSTPQYQNPRLVFFLSSSVALLDPDPDTLVRGTDSDLDPSLIKQK